MLSGDASGVAHLAGVVLTRMRRRAAERTFKGMSDYAEPTSGPNWRR